MYKYKSIFGSHLDLVKKTTRECSPDFNEVDLELLLAFLVVGTVFSHIQYSLYMLPVLQTVNYLRLPVMCPCVAWLAGLAWSFVPAAS